MPALANTFLFVEPLQHYLEYSSLVLHQLIAENRQSGQTITELIGDDANPTKVWDTLDSLNPIVYSMCGHGAYDKTSVECTELLVTVGETDKLAKFKDRVVHTNSCQCGAQLGPAIMTAGALGYVGSNESFWFYVGDDANTTRAVRSPFLAEWAFDVGLLQGKTVGEARTYMMQKYEEELTYWVEGDGKNHADAGEIANIIGMNKGVSTFAGEAGTLPSPAGGTTTLASNILLPLVAALGAVGLYFLLRK